jgi:hypothetical protein
MYAARGRDEASVAKPSKPTAGRPGAPRKKKRKPKEFTREKLRERAARALEAQQLLAALYEEGFSDLQIAYHSKVSWRAVYRWRTGSVPHPTGLATMRAFARRRGIVWKSEVKVKRAKEPKAKRSPSSRSKGR